MLFGEVMVMYASPDNPEWRKLSEKSRTSYERELRELKGWAHLRVEDITRSMVIGLRDAYYDKPGKCQSLLKTVKNVMSYARDRDIIKYNPASEMKNMPPTNPIMAWTESEITAFMFYAPDRLRQALVLALYTGQRRSDLIKMRWDEYDGNHIDVVQQKTGRKMRVPVHPELKTMLDAMPRQGKTILINHYGQAWSENAISVAFLRQNRELNINKTLHGLRKTAAVKLAEAGCTPHQIAAVTGHASLRMVEHYTREVDQQRLADEAMGMWR